MHNAFQKCFSVNNLIQLINCHLKLVQNINSTYAITSNLQYQYIIVSHSNNREIMFLIKPYYSGVYESKAVHSKSVL